MNALGIAQALQPQQPATHDFFAAAAAAGPNHHHRLHQSAAAELNAWHTYQRSMNPVLMNAAGSAFQAQSASIFNNSAGYQPGSASPTAVSRNHTNFAQLYSSTMYPKCI